MSDLSIGIDIGTTQTKGVVFDEKGIVQQTVYKGYPMIQETDGMAEQNPEQIFQAVIYCLKTLVAKNASQEIAVVSFSTAMHSLILMDVENRPLTQMITWADNRAKKSAESFKGTVVGQALYERTGVPMHPMTPFHKIRWLKVEQPDIYQKTTRFIGIKEYIYYRLTNEYVTDFSTASGTGFFNIHTMKWDGEALSLLEISEKMLPSLAPPSKQMNALLPSWRRELGVSAQTIFVLGGADGPLANLGVGAVEKGVITLTVGTSGAFRCIVDRPVLHPQAETFCFALDGHHWVIGGATSNGAGIFEWAFENFLKEEQVQAKLVGNNPYEAVMTKVSEIPVGSEGLLFYPYLLGERAPLWDEEATGSFIGLKRTHTDQMMVRAVIEGICLNLKWILTEVESISGSGSIKEIRASGGFAASAEFKKIMANVLGYSLKFMESMESSSFGAVLLAWKSSGKITQLNEIADYINFTEVVTPERQASNCYQVIYPVYLSVQQQLMGSNSLLSELRKKLE